MPRWTPLQITRAVALGLLVLAFVGGAALVGLQSGSEVDDPAGYIASFYEGGDVDGLLNAVPQVAFGDVPPDQVRDQLGQLLRSDVTVADVADPEDAGGVPVTRVDTADGFVWCVGPSGTVTPACTVAVAPVDASSGVDGLEVPVAEVFQQLGGPITLTLILENTTDAPIALGDLELTTEDGDATVTLLDAQVAGADQSPVPADPSAGEVPAGGLMRTIFELGLDDLGQSFTLGSDAGVSVTVEGLRYLHR